ncbi:RidA family protein [Pseudomonas mediterranea]|jgi:enamine deaminase RidA (YjgF/YER057c/UK114 family)|uniref:Enamine deaminase RidA, house cleaning of reactive enamine intermediates, YjgF/YER057c/UK114 family n=1 Tax=Pseudomonas mediterranea TaxID=183795 RepID=A0AAX2DA03_9PSED|nr:Rid family hydrolase [Pseudomonas mediterranea]KGU85480.1 endoribonuclease L-PSP [Pseudomonas mediterranea CFBP 5447]MBL0844950.1 RidA family protein [Pseudomonas mediterranea]MDU9027097.1 Rid family hydrolase [Pseudomonas mediterranea]QHA84078.1 RidA family protein [Pseudomonas mediterranea]UZD99780.1 Rid family hydrolase [Pseudomonas mediterranea]
MQTIERVPSGHAGRSRSCAYANTVYTVATSADTSLDIAGQTHHALAALKASLEGLGSDVSRMLSAQVLLADMGTKAIVDEIWARWIGDNPQHWPQRACYGVDLGGKLLIEIIVTAARGAADDA